MFDQSLIKRSGQMWKLALGGSLLAAGAGLVLLSAAGVQSSNDSRFVLTLFSGFALFFLSSVVLVLFVRCPRCHAKLAWRAVAEGSALNVAGRLLTMVRCPRCAYPDAR
jgi:hypothetical protein